MNSTSPKSDAMEYRDREFRFDSDMLLELESEFVREPSDGKKYCQKRSSNATRRKAPKASHPGYGIGGRRNRRWTW